MSPRRALRASGCVLAGRRRNFYDRALMKKELRPFHDHVTCAVCARTMLKGERTEPFLATSGERHIVCALCFTRAEDAGWLRESAHGDMPARGPRQQERRSLLQRFRRQPPVSEPVEGGEGVEDDEPVESVSLEEAAEIADPGMLNGDVPARGVPPPPPPEVGSERRRAPRHVRAVPTTAEVRVERALELFNASEHQRTASGLARSLGSPWVTAIADLEALSTVTVLIAWELSWYRYRVDLGDVAEAVSLQSKGDELADIESALREWNAVLDEDGRLAMAEAPR